MKVIILAGGKGTRLQPLTDNCPKPLITINKHSLLRRQIDLAKRYGYREFVLLTGYLADQIEAEVGDGADLGVYIAHCREDYNRGTAGALAAARQLGFFSTRSFIFYGDVLMDVDLEAMEDFHCRKGAQMTLAAHPSNHPYDSDLLEVDQDERVTAVYTKPHPPECRPRNLASAALYVAEPGIIDGIDIIAGTDIARDVLPALLADEQRVFAYRTPEYIKDCGTWERLQRCRREDAAGIPQRLNARRCRPAVFLDRDGVINQRLVDHVTDRQDLELLPDAAAAIAELNESGVLVILVTNQPAIAKGFMEFSDLAEIHRKLDRELATEGAYLDDVYFCPHHPERGFNGERGDLKYSCWCRKPNTGLLERAANDYRIDVSRSLMVGDSRSDIDAGKAFGVGTIFIGRAGDAPLGCNKSFSSLKAATSFICEYCLGKVKSTDS